MAKKVMLLKVLVQTVWVEVSDDGSVEEKIGEAVMVPAAQWPNFYEAWLQDFNNLAAQVALESQPAPNRAQRRAKAKVTTNGV